MPSSKLAIAALQVRDSLIRQAVPGRKPPLPGDRTQQLVVT